MVKFRGVEMENVPGGEIEEMYGKPVYDFRRVEDGEMV